MTFSELIESTGGIDSSACIEKYMLDESEEAIPSRSKKKKKWKAKVSSWNIKHDHKKKLEAEFLKAFAVHMHHYHEWDSIQTILTAWEDNAEYITFPDVEGYYKNPTHEFRLYRNGNKYGIVEVNKKSDSALYKKRYSHKVARKIPILSSPNRISIKISSGAHDKYD